MEDSIDEAEDRASELPDSLLLHILSFLKFKCAARTCILSKRWNYIWTSISTLDFSSWNLSGHRRWYEIDMFMDFVDNTLHHHDKSTNIQKFSLHTHRDMNASRVRSWIENVTRRVIEEVSLSIDLRNTFIIPPSLFTCESLIKLEISGISTIHLPRSFCFPKLKSLTLCGTRFTDGCWNCWNAQQFSNCPVLEDLFLQDCTWYHARNFCISTPTLKLLVINNATEESDGLHYCALEINAPNLVSLTYYGRVPKDFVLSSFQNLEIARILFSKYVSRKQPQIDYGAAVSKFFRALSHVQSLTLFAETLEALSRVDDFTNILPTFHELEELMLTPGKATDQALFSLLKEAPNLTLLEFAECITDYEEYEHHRVTHMFTAEYLFQQLKVVSFVEFSGNVRQMRWAKLILKNAKALESITLVMKDSKIKEVLMSELLSLPRASDRCEFEFEE